MTINLLLFGACREAASGQSELNLETTAAADVQTVWDALIGQYPALVQFSSNVLFAVNEEYAPRTRVLAAGDTLAIFPPVSGG
ncbi:MAG: MoaD/ThiS family protein [Acidobacteria bacterium]|nr:MoaD/ThiS family protein [Acidobacteriota bacterium]